MPRPAHRFIEPLSAKQLQEPQQIRDGGRTKRIRHRAHAILSSHAGKQISEIAEIFQVLPKMSILNSANPDYS